MTVTTTAAGSISFNKDIRPILADRCFTCHGPDSAARKADLRLDLEDAAKALLKDGDGARAMVYMIDGMVVRINTLGNAARLRHVLDEVGARALVKLTMEMF